MAGLSSIGGCGVKVDERDTVYKCATGAGATPLRPGQRQYPYQPEPLQSCDKFQGRFNSLEAAPCGRNFSAAS